MTDTIKTQFNRANPNDLADLFRRLVLGSFLAGNVVQHLRRRDPAVSPYNLSTVEAVVPGDGAKAASILRATSIAGTVTGELTPVAYGTTPSTGQIAVAPNGSIVVLGTDAITSLDVVYAPERGDEIEMTLAVDPSTGYCDLPASRLQGGTVLLLEAESLEGTLVAKMKVLVPTSSAPATTNARLSIPKTRVHFAVADAVTKARVRLLVAPAASHDLAALLGSDYAI